MPLGFAPLPLRNRPYPMKDSGVSPAHTGLLILKTWCRREDAWAISAGWWVLLGSEGCLAPLWHF